MQILLSIGELEDNVGLKTRKKVRELAGLGKKDKLRLVNIGPGADFMVFLITYGGLAFSIWQIPTVLKTGLQDWEWLIKKLKGFIKKKQLVSLDIEAAGLLAVGYLIDKYGEAPSHMLDAHTFNIVDLSSMIYGQKSNLAARPHNYYVFTFCIDMKRIVLSVRSTGKIRILEVFEDLPYGLIDSEE